MSDVDHALRDHFLEQLTYKARAQGVDAEPLICMVRQRLAWGEERYGSGAYRERDNIPELSQEAADIVCYALFDYLNEVEKTEDIDAHVPNDLFMAALYAAMADWHARRARVTA